MNERLFTAEQEAATLRAALEGNVLVPKPMLERICAMVYASRGEQHRMNYITDHEYGELVRLRHGGKDSIETVMTALAETARSK